MNFFLLSYTSNPFLKKGVHSKRKEFALRESKFFPFGVDPFLKGTKYLDSVVFPESVFVHLKALLTTELKTVI